MKQKLIAGNWKMNGSLAANEALVKGVQDGLSAALAGKKAQVAVCVPAAYLSQVQQLTHNSGIDLGSQDVSAHEQGAGGFPVPRQVLPVVIDDLELNAELQAALSRPDGLVHRFFSRGGEFGRAAPVVVRGDRCVIEGCSRHVLSRQLVLPCFTSEREMMFSPSTLTVISSAPPQASDFQLS